MIEKAFSGSKTYYGWIGGLLALQAIGFLFYLTQLDQGLSVTGMNRDVSWGFYIAQFTYLVGVAASAVMLVLPYYLHHYKPFGKVIIFGEFLAVAAVAMCMLFIVVDLGQPQRLMNVILHPTPGSVLFWDMVVLNGYLILNGVIGWVTLASMKKEVPPPAWVKPLVILSIVWAFSIHTVTAFLYSGLPGRHYWLTAILAARFLASAFCSGPALLTLLLLIMRKVAKLEIAQDVFKTLSKIITYAMLFNMFFLGLEVFTAFYSNIPGHKHAFEYLFVGHHGYNALVPFMWTSMILAAISLVLLVIPKFRENMRLLPVALVCLFLATWIDKGLGLVVAGFVPTPMEHITEYAPTVPELFIALGVYATGALILTLLWKAVMGVKEDTEQTV